RRDLRPGRRPGLRPVHQGRRLRGPDRRDRLRERVHPHPRPEPRPGEELLDPRPPLGPVQHPEPQAGPALPRAAHRPGRPGRDQAPGERARPPRRGRGRRAAGRRRRHHRPGRRAALHGRSRRVIDAAELRRRTQEFLAAHPPADLPPAPPADAAGDPLPPSADAARLDFLRARFDAGLAWVHYPEGLGGLGAPRALQAVVDAELAAAGAPDNDPRRIGIGLGMAAPTILGYGTEEQKQRFLRPLWVGEEVWCQLFSEPGAGSDLAALGTRAVRDEEGASRSSEAGSGGDWVVDGQKVWTSSAHVARWAILIARTDPDVPKHRGISYFICDMTDPGVEVRPLRQITGEAEFNEVFLTG